MAAVQRHLRGDTCEVECDVHGNTVIEKGDLVWTYKISTFGPKTSVPSGNVQTADWYTYPMSYLAGCTTVYYDAQFTGIAMKGSISGTTEKIPIATAGIFRYPLNAQAGVTIGQIVSGVTSASVTNEDQLVKCGPSSGVTNAILGICVKTESGGAENVDFTLITQFSGVSYGYMKAY